MKKEVFVTIIFGLFSRSGRDADLELLPPPPPFPDLDMENEDFSRESKEGKPKARTTIIIKRPKENVDDILERAIPSEQELTSANIEEPWNKDISHQAESTGMFEVLGNSQQEINSAISGVKESQQKPSFWNRIFMPRKGEAKEQLTDLHEYEVAQENMTEVERVMRNITMTRKMVMNHELQNAKDAYVGIMKSYRLMTVDEQGQVYEAIKELYEGRKSAESMSRR